MSALPHRWVLASGNASKLEELRSLLGGRDLEIVAQSELGIGAAEETGETFVENALLKARHAAAASGLPAIADDSGLSVDALGGAPGVRSARYAGPGADDRCNVAALLAALAEVPEPRRAHFHCVVVALRSPHDPAPIVAQGRWEGTIARSPSGSGGFGYDPVFFDPALGVTAGELPASLKNRVSHRARALAQLIDALGLPATGLIPPASGCHRQVIHSGAGIERR